MAKHETDGEARPSDYVGRHRVAEQTADDLRREGGWAVTGREDGPDTSVDKGWDSGR